MKFLSAFLVLFLSFLCASLVQSDSLFPNGGLVIDSLRDLMFWTRPANNEVWVSSTVSDPKPRLFSPGLLNPQSLAVNPTTGFLYVANTAPTSNVISQIDLHGFASNFYTAPFTPGELSFDLASGELLIAENCGSCSQSRYLSINVVTLKASAISSANYLTAAVYLQTTPSQPATMALFTCGNTNMVVQLAPEAQRWTSNVRCTDHGYGSIIQDAAGMVYSLHFLSATQAVMEVAIPADVALLTQWWSTVVFSWPSGVIPLGFDVNRLGQFYYTDGHLTSLLPISFPNEYVQLNVSSPFGGVIKPMQSYFFFTVSSMESRTLNIKYYSSSRFASITAFVSVKSATPNGFNYDFSKPYAIGGGDIVINNPGSNCRGRTRCQYTIAIGSAQNVEIQLMYTYSD